MTNDGKDYPIFKFDQIVDIEVGLLKLINERYHDTDTFYWSLMEAPTKVQLWLLYSRTRKNPLTVIAKDRDDKETLDAYYDEFIDKEYVYILRNSIVTNLYNAIKTFIKIKGITPVIVCKNSMEANYLNKLDKETFSKCNIIIEKKYAEAITDMNDVIYLKSIDEIVPILAKTQYKNIYLAGYRYNFEDDKKEILLRDYAILTSGIERVKIYDPYNENDMIKGV